MIIDEGSQSTFIYAFIFRLKFDIPEGIPLWIYITPCGGNVHWQLFHLPSSHNNGNLFNYKFIKLLGIE